MRLFPQDSYGKKRMVILGILFVVLTGVTAYVYNDRLEQKKMARALESVQEKWSIVTRNEGKIKRIYICNDGIAPLAGSRLFPQLIHVTIPLKNTNASGFINKENAIPLFRYEGGLEKKMEEYYRHVLAYTVHGNKLAHLYFYSSSELSARWTIGKEIQADRTFSPYVESQRDSDWEEYKKNCVSKSS